jgi:hypothetical protein
MPKDFSTFAKLNRWGRKYAMTVGDKRPMQFRLMHRGANGKMNEVQTWENEQVDDASWKLILEEMITAVQDDAEGMAGVQTYFMFADGADEKIISRLPIRQATHDEDDDEDDHASEPATMKGIVSMLMRHVEAKERVHTASLGTILRHQHQIIEAQQIQQEKFDEKYFGLLEQREKLMSEQHTRDLQTEEQRMTMENRQQIVGKVIALLPAIAKKFTGVSMEGDLPIEVHEMQTMLGTMTEEEIEGIKSVLSPEKVILLLSLMEKNAQAAAKNSH